MKENKFASLTDSELAEAVTPHWQHLTTVLPKLQEREVYRLLRWELENRKNEAIVIRLHQRLTRMKATRERKTMLQDGKLPKSLELTY